MNSLKQAEVVDSQMNTITPSTMIQMAIDKGTDVDQLSKLFELNERWEANEAKKAFVSAMSRFRHECPPIRKTRKAHNAMYAGLPEIISDIEELMFHCGLSHSWKTFQRDGMTTVECVVTHIMGHSETTQLTAEGDKSGSKNNIQAIGSTVTYLQRYTLCSILGIATTDDDGQGSESIGYDEVIDLLEGAKTIGELDERAKRASALPKEEKAKARDVYKLRKEELQNAGV